MIKRTNNKKWNIKFYIGYTTSNQRFGPKDKVYVWRNTITVIVKRTIENETSGNGMCSCFYLRLSKQLLGGLGIRLIDEVADMMVRIKRGLSTCCYSQPPEPPGIYKTIK